MKGNKRESLSEARESTNIRAALEMLPKLLDAKNQSEAVRLIAELFGKIPELMQYKGFQATMMAGISLAVENATAQELTPERLALLLQNSGLSQQELADAVGVPQPHISGYVTGNRPIPKKHVPNILGICTDAIMRRLVSGLQALSVEHDTGSRSPRESRSHR